MIGLLSGKLVADESSGPVLIDVGGVGYEVHVPAGTTAKAEKVPQGIRLLIHTHVREDTLQLFGFASALERLVFRMLLGVPNVGPKTALGVLSALPPPELARAVQASDVAGLSKVPGIGKKTAERLVLELQEKLTGIGPEVAQRKGTDPSGQGDAQLLLRALVNMGYRPTEAERAVKALGEKVGMTPIADLLREALQGLAG
ncbi:MAG: Holliday junction branch migration protein RuvA [Polyangiaceae bacterium]|nr:Holliday junction branch migration protein RuvA [Polyangiaceae bacterium]